MSPPASELLRQLSIRIGVWLECPILRALRVLPLAIGGCVRRLGLSDALVLSEQA